MLKKIIWVLLILIGIGIAGALYLKSNLDEIVRKAIISYGRELTQATVELEEVKIDIKKGKGELEDFVLGNPAKFKSKYALKLEEAHLVIDPVTIFADTVIVEDMVFEDIEIYYEKNEFGTNFEALKNNINSAKAYSSGVTEINTDAQASQQNNNPSPSKKFIIKRVLLSGTEVEVVLSVLGKEEIEFDLPDIELTNIGIDNGGVTPEELTKILLSAIEKHLITNIDIDKIDSKITRELNRIQEKNEDDIEEVIDQIEKLF